MKAPLPKLRFDFIANFLNTRSLRERLLALGFAAALVFFVDYFFWLKPAAQTLMRTMPTLSSFEAELDELKQDKKNEAVIREKGESAQKEFKEKENRIGASSQIASLLENLSKLASESGVKIMSLKPIEVLNPASGKLYFAVPIQISATAGTHELGGFLMRLETGATFFKITDLKIAANPANERKHSVEMMVETYRKA